MFMLEMVITNVICCPYPFHEGMGKVFIFILICIYFGSVYSRDNDKDEDVTPYC